MCDNQKFEVVEESPKIECAYDDSGYLTTTQISFEGADFFDASHTLKMPTNIQVVDSSTPTAVRNKINRQTLQTSRKLDGVLVVSTKPSGSDCGQNRVNHLSVTSITTRNRIDSLPNLLLPNRNTRMEPSGEAFGRFRSIRLLSVDSLMDTRMYKGWMGFGSHETLVSSVKHIDFIKQLCAQRYLTDIGIQIFRYLEPKDLLAASKVSVLWKQTVKQDAVLASTLRAYNFKLKSQISASKTTKENMPSKVVESSARRSSCTDIINIVMDRKKRGTLKPPQVPSADRFAEEARKNGVWLRACPECNHPAEVRDCASVARCLRDGCGHLFCPECRFKAHGKKKCLSGITDSRIKLEIGGKKSRRNLKRL